MTAMHQGGRRPDTTKPQPLSFRSCEGKGREGKGREGSGLGVWGSGSGRRLGRRTFPGVAPPPGGRSIPVEASRPGLRVRKRPGAELLRLTGAARLASGTWAKWRDVRSGRDLHRVGLGLGLGSGLGSGLGLALRRVRVRVGAQVRVGVGVGVRVRVKAGVGVRVKAGVGVRNAPHLS